MGTVIKSKYGKLLFPHKGSLGWLANVSDLEIELSIEWEDFLWSCRFRRGFTAAGSLSVDSLSPELREEALMNLQETALKGFLLDVDTDGIDDLEALRFPNVL